MKEMIYADNAATTKLDEKAFEAMKKYFFDDYGNASQPYSFGRRARKALKCSRECIAECINCEANEIYFTSGGSESDNWVLKRFGDTKKKRIIITSEIEHHAILNSCKTICDDFNDIVYLKVDNTGIVRKDQLIDELKKYKNSDAQILVSVMMANNEIGTIEPIKELAEITHQYGGYFHTDAVQAVGHINIDVKELDVDFLSASSHKFNGPKGVGFLYIKKDSPISSFIDGGAQENNFRAGTENVACIVGMATALKNNCLNMIVNQKKLLSIEEELINKLNSFKLDFIRNGSANHLPGLVNLSFKGQEGEILLHRLDLMGALISTGSACDSVNTQVSHVINAINVPVDYQKGTIRISFGKYNSIEDADSIGYMLRKIILGN